MKDSIKDTILTIHAFKKHKDDEFLIYKSRIGTNIISNLYATPLMYLSNKRIWIIDWSFIQTHAPAVISLQKANNVDKAMWKAPIGLKNYSITLATNEEPDDKILITMKESKRDALYNAIKALQETIIGENRYMNQEEVRAEIFPLLSNK